MSRIIAQPSLYTIILKAVVQIQVILPSLSSVFLRFSPPQLRIWFLIMFHSSSSRAHRNLNLKAALYFFPVLRTQVVNHLYSLELHLTVGTRSFSNSGATRSVSNEQGDTDANLNP
jgi:hypothetical protein